MATRISLRTFGRPTAMAILLGLTVMIGGSSKGWSAEVNQDKPAGNAKDADGAKKSGDKDKPAVGETTEVKLTTEAIKRYGVSLGRATKQKLVSHVLAPAHVSFNTNAMLLSD